MPGRGSSRNSFPEAPLNLSAYKLKFVFSKGVSVEEEFAYIEKLCNFAVETLELSVLSKSETLINLKKIKKRRGSLVYSFSKLQILKQVYK